MDAIVVDTKAEVLECVTYMRTNKVGTANFIPLDAIKVKPVNERLRSLGPRQVQPSDIMPVTRVFFNACRMYFQTRMVCDTAVELKLMSGRNKLCRFSGRL